MSFILGLATLFVAVNADSVLRGTKVRILRVCRFTLEYKALKLLFPASQPWVRLWIFGRLLKWILCTKELLWWILCAKELLRTKELLRSKKLRCTKKLLCSEEL